MRLIKIVSLRNIKKLLKFFFIFQIFVFAALHYLKALTIKHKVHPYNNEEFFPYFEALKNNQRSYFENYNRLLGALLYFNELDWLMPVKPKPASKIFNK